MSPQRDPIAPTGISSPSHLPSAGETAGIGVFKQFKAVFKADGALLGERAKPHNVSLQSILPQRAQGRRWQWKLGKFNTDTGGFSFTQQKLTHGGHRDSKKARSLPGFNKNTYRDNGQIQNTSRNWRPPASELGRVRCNLGFFLNKNNKKLCSGGWCT